MIVKIHIAENKKIVAIADSNLVGKKFEDGKLQLDLTSDFYKGVEMTEEQIVEVVKEAYIIHLVGEESIELALRHNWIEIDNVIKIKDIPHAETVIVQEN